MARAIALFLLLANGVFFAWSQGLLAPYGLAPAQVSEPQRLQQQILPERVIVVPPSARAAVLASAAPDVPAAPAECLTAGLFDAARSTVLSNALAAALPAGSWSLEEAVEPGRWIVYMGRYLNDELLERKKAELRGIRVRFEAPPAALEPGLSLGSHDSEAAAARMLGGFTQRGVRTARVVQVRPEIRGMRLRLPQVDAALKTQLDTVKPALGGVPLRTCQG